MAEPSSIPPQQLAQGLAQEPAMAGRGADRPDRGATLARRAPRLSRLWPWVVVALATLLFILPRLTLAQGSTGSPDKAPAGAATTDTPAAPDATATTDAPDGMAVKEGEAAPPAASTINPKEAALARGEGVSHLPSEDAFALEQRRQRLEAHEREVADRERQLATLRDALDQRLDRLTALQRQIDDYLNQFKKREEANLAQLVKVVQAMRADAAAASLSQMDERLATLILARMNEKKAAKIMNVLPPERAVLLARRMGDSGADPK